MISFILSCFFIWRLLLFLAAYTGSLLLPFEPRFPYSDVYLLPSRLPAWLWSFANFDGVHYLTIAAKGYSAKFTQVFFPLFPVILGILQNILFFFPSLLVALTISNLFFLSALFVFYKLLRIDYDNIVIKWIFIFLLLTPTSFFFASLYTEGMFLLLVVSAFYFARKKRWIAASVAVGLASATRFVGIFLLPALLWEWHKNRIKNQESRIMNTNNILTSYFLLLTSPVLYIAPLGLIVYMIYLQINFGDALYFWHAQPVFGAAREGTGIVLLPQVFWRYFKILTSVPANQLSFWIPLAEFVATLSAIFLLIFAHRRKIRFSYLIYSWPALILPTLTGTLSSMPRYILIIFPIFIVLGLIKSKVIKFLILTSFFLLLVVFTVLFTRGRWIA